MRMFVKDPLGATHYSEGLATASEAVELARAAARLPAGLQLRCEQSGRPIARSSPLNPAATVTVMLAGGLPGGKGTGIPRYCSRNILTGFSQAASVRFYAPSGPR